MSAVAYGSLMLVPGASGTVYYERNKNEFNLYIDGVSGINIPAYSWTVIAGPIAPEFHSKSQHYGLIGLCIIGDAVCQVKINRSSNNIEVYSAKAFSSAYSVFGFGTWIY